MKTISLALSLIALALCASAQTATSINATPMQKAPVNSYTQVTGINPAVVTITGVANQRVRLYSIAVVCNTTSATFVPVVSITDAGNLVLQTPPTTYTAITNPFGFYHWAPGYAFSLGGTVVITGNYGGGCSGGTQMTVQADQF